MDFFSCHFGTFLYSMERWKWFFSLHKYFIFIALFCCIVSGKLDDVEEELDATFAPLTSPSPPPDYTMFPDFDDTVPDASTTVRFCFSLHWFISFCIF